MSASIRARTSSVDRISCFTGVPMVARLEAMKSASLPGSVMLAASVCRSSDSSGDSDTTCWKLLLMLRCSASISRWSSSRSWSGATVTAARRYGRAWTMRSSVSALDALDDQPQAAVGQLEHLVDVGGGADRIEVFLHRLFDRGFALREDADQLAGGVRLFDEADRGLARDRQRHERIGKQDRVAERQYRQFGRNLERPFGVET